MNTFFTVVASFVGVWAFFKYILLIEMRVDSNTYKTLYDLCKDERRVMIYEEFVSEKRHPVAYVAFCFFRGAPWFYLNHSERLMQAGFNDKDHVTVLTCFRWRYSRLKFFLKSKLKEMQLCTLGVPARYPDPPPHGPGRHAFPRALSQLPAATPPSRLTCGCACCNATYCLHCEISG